MSFYRPCWLTLSTRLKSLKWALTVFFLVLGLATLTAYIKIGREHAPLRTTSRYDPAGTRRSRYG